MNPTVLGAIYAAIAVVVAGLVKALFDLLVAAKAAKVSERTLAVTTEKTAAEIAHSLNEDLDRRNDKLQTKVESLEDKVEALSRHVEEVKGLLVTEKVAREHAEREAIKHREDLFQSRRDCEEWRIKYEESEKLRREEVAELQAKYEGEQGVTALLGNLYEVNQNSRPPDIALLATIDEKLQKSGYLRSKIAPKGDK